MKIVLPILSALLTGVVAFFYFQNTIKEQQSHWELQKLQIVQSVVEKNLQDISTKISSQLQAFSQTIAEDRIFALRLLAENDRSSVDVTEKAIQFINPMKISVLEITDSSFVILSSGHFAASAGNSAAEKSKLSVVPVCFDDNIMGQQRLTLQSKIQFHISDIPFYVMGGLEIDEQFLKSLSPAKNVTILLKRGKEYIGKSDIRSISEITNHKILINDEEFLASELQLPYTGEGPAPSLLVILN